jgi:two-component system, OmpR family, alkaline phosphatase synthesis response regulator PhoP
MGNPRIMLVDDEEPLRELVRPYLEAEGFDVIEASSGPSALELFNSQGAELAIVDVMLPGFDGIEFVRRVRRTSDLPVILLTARREEGERVAGLRLGADDYVTKPFSAPELVARVLALLRRSIGISPCSNGITVGDIEIKPAARQVWVADREVELTRREFDLLVALATRLGRVVSRTELLRDAWNTTFLAEKNVDVHLASLRRKVGTSLKVTALRGVGYRMEAE